jgi:predicted Fe-Mo cluster-binding NifX family protein
MQSGETKMRIAIPIWQSRVSPVFDVAGRLLLVDVEDGRETARSEETLGETFLPGKAKRLKDLGVDVLICGAISRPLAMLASQAGVAVVPWVAGDIDEVLNRYLEDGLADPRYAMPGCRCRRAGRGRRWRGNRLASEGWTVGRGHTSSRPDETTTS